MPASPRSPIARRLDIEDGGAVAAFAEENAIDFVIVGPEAPLAAGVADRLREAGLLVFGPSEPRRRGWRPPRALPRKSATPQTPPPQDYGHFTDADAAKAHVRAKGAPIVVKADGLAAGKGVIVAMTEDEALAAIDDMFGGAFGGAGAEVVIEEFMEGEEASFFVLVRWRGRAADRHRAGSQARRRRRHRPQYRRHGRLFPGAGLVGEVEAKGDGRDREAHAWR